MILIPEGCGNGAGLYGCLAGIRLGYDAAKSLVPRRSAGVAGIAGVKWRLVQRIWFLVNNDLYTQKIHPQHPQISVTN